MTKILPKGKKVTGTKKKDKIVSTGKGVWKKALTVKAGAGNDVINFKKSKYKNTIYGEAGKDTIYGGTKNDKITGGKGNYKINAGKGKNIIYGSQNGGNTFVYRAGDGQDVIYTGYGKSANFNTLKFENILIGAISIVGFDGKDLKLKYSATHGDTITIKDFLSDAEDISKINATDIWVEDMNNSRCRLTDLYTTEVIKHVEEDYKTTINATPYNDIFINNWPLTTLNLGDGNDFVYINSKTSFINAGDGQKTYNIGVTQLKETTNITPVSGKVTINLENYVKYSVSNYDEGDDLKIEFAYGSIYSDDKTVVNFNNWYNNPVEVTINCKEEEKTSVFDFVGSAYMDWGTMDDDTITSADEEIIAARGGNDNVDLCSYSDSMSFKIFGGDGNDTLRGGQGDDLIYSSYATKKESFKYGEINNILYGQDGNDTLCAFGDDTKMCGEDGDDTYKAYLTNNILIDDSGSDNNTLIIEKPDRKDAGKAYIVFDIDNYETTMDGGYYILNKDSYNYWLDNASFEDANGIYGGIKVIQTRFWSPTLKQITDELGGVVKAKDIQDIAEEVAGWLSSNSKESVGDVIKYGTDTERSDLVAYFNNFNDTIWQIPQG